MAGEPELVENHTDEDTNGYVTYLQQMLQHNGYYQDGAVDGIFGPITDAAVRQFQEDKGLTVDGWVGPITWGALNGEDGGGNKQIEIDLNDYPALQRAYAAYQEAGDDEVAAADTHLAMIGLNIEGMDTDDDDGSAYA